MADDSGPIAKVIRMARPKPASLIDQILSPAAKAVAIPRPLARPHPTAAPPSPVVEPERLPPPKKTDPLPVPGDPYRACAQHMNRLGTGERMIDIVDRDCFSEAFNYSDLRQVSWRRPKTPGSGPLLVLLFIAARVVEVVVTGRNLEEIRHYIREGMLPWIWEQPAGYKARDDRMAVITAIEIRELED